MRIFEARLPSLLHSTQLAGSPTAAGDAARSCGNSRTLSQVNRRSSSILKDKGDGTPNHLGLEGGFTLAMYTQFQGRFQGLNLASRLIASQPAPSIRDLVRHTHFGSEVLVCDVASHGKSCKFISSLGCCHRPIARRSRLTTQWKESNCWRRGRLCRRGEPGGLIRGRWRH